MEKMYAVIRRDKYSGNKNNLWLKVCNAKGEVVENPIGKYNEANVRLISRTLNFAGYHVWVVWVMADTPIPK